MRQHYCEMQNLLLWKWGLHLNLLKSSGTFAAVELLVLCDMSSSGDNLPWGAAALYSQSSGFKAAQSNRPSNCLLFGWALFGTVHTGEWQEGNVQMSLGCLPLAAQLGEGFAQISMMLFLLMPGSPWDQWHSKAVLYLISLTRYKRFGSIKTAHQK